MKSPKVEEHLLMLQSSVEWMVGMANLAILPHLFDFFTRRPCKKRKDKAKQWM